MRNVMKFLGLVALSAIGLTLVLGSILVITPFLLALIGVVILLVLLAVIATVILILWDSITFRFNNNKKHKGNDVILIE